MPSITLTDRFVAGVKPSGEGDKDYPDRVVRGLRLRVFASGIEGWAFRYAASDRHARLSLGTYPAVSLARARTKALEAQHPAHSRLHPPGRFAQAGHQSRR